MVLWMRSMKFSNGSYVISVGLFAGIASINTNDNTFFMNGIFAALPIVMLFYLYNHIRYMALQFKLSGYAKYLEEIFMVSIIITLALFVIDLLKFFKALYKEIT